MFLGFVWSLGPGRVAWPNHRATAVYARAGFLVLITAYTVWAGDGMTVKVVGALIGLLGLAGIALGIASIAREPSPAAAEDPRSADATDSADAEAGDPGEGNRPDGGSGS